jgi:spore germination protein YaaH
VPQLLGRRHAPVRRPALGRRLSGFRSRLVTGLVALATCCAGLGALVTSASPAAAANPHPVVSGYLPYWSIDAANADVAGNYDLFTDGALFWFDTTAPTTIVTKASTATLTSAISALHAHHVKAILTVTDSMAPSVTGAMMASATQRAQHVAALMNVVQTYGADGLDLDYEGIGSNATTSAQDRTGYPALLAALAAQLHASGKTLAVSLSAKTGEPGLTYGQQAYDYVAIGKVVDQAKIMTYDQHWSGGSPGAIAGEAWTDSVISFAASAITPSKVFMGIPLYGYNWGTPGTSASGVTFTAAQALMAQYGAQRQWDAVNDAPYFTYTDTSGVGHTVYYNDAQSVQAKLPLVGRYGLGGVAFWSLGGEDPAVWSVLQAFTYGSNPFGNLDAVRSVPGGLEFAGWSIDPNVSDPIQVAIYADGHLMGNAVANVDRPDVANVYGFFGSAHGFDSTVGLPPGRHTVCAYGLNTGPGDANTWLGCGSAVALGGNPTGYFEALAPVPGGFSLHGWDIDPDTAAPVATHVYVDGHLAAILTADQQRPDVGAAFAQYGAAHGYSATIAATSGPHTVCVYAINAGYGTTNPQLGCRSVTVLAGNPIGNVDTVLPSGAMWGWAIDPDTAAPIAVDVYVDGAPVAELAADESRPDVAGVYPAYGPGHGFSTILALTPGKHTVCAYGINQGAGTTNTTLGCRVVTAPPAS